MSSPVALVKRPARAGTGPRVTSQLAGQEGLEPPTTGFGDRDSGQLSYCPLRGTAGMLAQPDGNPPEVEVYVANGPRVEPRSVLTPPYCLRRMDSVGRVWPPPAAHGLRRPRMDSASRVWTPPAARPRTGCRRFAARDAKMLAMAPSNLSDPRQA